MRRALVVLITIVLVLGTVLWYDGYLVEPAHGTLLAAADGAGIYYHRDSQRGTFGLEYECVEFVNRWLVVHGDRNLTKTGHAISYFNEARAKGLTPHRNGGGTKPEHGDVIVFKSAVQQYGHVGIVMEVGADNVLVAQQNVTLRLWLVVKPMPFERFPLTNINDKWTVMPRRSFTCVGWSRPR